MLSDHAAAGGSVLAECLASGGKAPYRYEVKYNGADGSWISAQKYSSNNIVNIAPETTGQFTALVRAKDSTGKIISKKMSFEIYPTLCNTSSLSCEVMKAGKSVTVNCSSEGGWGKKQYSVWYCSNSTGKWSRKSDYSDKTTFSLTLKNAVDYIIRVNCKDEDGNIVKKNFDVNAYAALKNTSTVSSDNIQAGNSVTVNCSSTGGRGAKQYAVWYYNKNTKKWYQKTDYSDTATVDVTLRYAVDYTIRVNCRDEDGTIVKKDISVSVNQS